MIPWHLAEITSVFQFISSNNKKRGVIIIIFFYLKNNNPGNDSELFYLFFVCAVYYYGFCASCKPGIRKLLKSIEVLMKYEN